jgi:hypothetical protein
MEIKDMMKMVAVALTERLELEQMTIPYLLAQFQQRLGPWELAVLQLRCEVLRTKRKIELIQQQLNQGKTPDLKEIDDSLEVEFLMWQQRIKEATEKIKEAQAANAEPLSPAEATERTKLYRLLVKRLHPDLNSEQNEWHRQLWQELTVAYQTGDLEAMRAIASALDALNDDKKPPLEMDQVSDLQAEHLRLQKSCREQRDRLAKLKQQPPLSLRCQWLDDAWVEQRRATLDTEAAELKAQLQHLTQYLQSVTPLHVIPEFTPSLN